MVVVVLVFDVRGKRIDGLKLRLAEGFAGFSQRYTASKAMNTNWDVVGRQRARARSNAGDEREEYKARIRCRQPYRRFDFPVYHTAFDSYEWLTKHADSLFHHHVAVAGIWGLLALHLADESILPFDYHSYVEQLQGHTGSLSKLLDWNISLHALVNSIQELASAAKVVEHEIKSRGDYVDLKLRVLNDRLMPAERGFLDAEGLRARQWFKHLLPPSDYESKLDFFHGIANALSQSSSKSQQNR
uniref:Transferrin receptor-like dimerisation domain-containing protein n=2 Tax=Populus TaxID=3689 RepID=A0A2K2A4Z9_POPTR|nr:Peptidase M28 family protein [Populus tomentosa]